MTIRFRHIIGLLIGTSVLTILGGCSDDSDAPGSQPQSQHELRVSMGAQRFSDVQTRSLPENFTEYNHSTALAPITQIQGYLTYKENGHPVYIPTIFNYTGDGSTNVWTSRIALQDAQYYLYGYMPKGVVGSDVTIAPVSGDDYSTGAVLTLKNLNAVSPDDICVIVGVGQYKDTPPDMSGKLGIFGFNSHADNGDNIYLLVDHIYAGMHFKMKLDETYDQLRQIKIKSMTMMPAVSTGEAVETVDAKVTLTANNDGTNPLTSVTFTNRKTSASPTPSVLYEGEGEFLSTSYKEFLACLCPTTTSAGGKYILETVYDVYDKKGGTDGKGRVIRENERAQNIISLRDALSAGQIFTVNITVQPTYLYMLSDPDLDNPTFIVNSD